MRRMVGLITLCGKLHIVGMMLTDANQLYPTELDLNGIPYKIINNGSSRAVYKEVEIDTKEETQLATEDEHYYIARITELIKMNTELLDVIKDMSNGKRGNT